MIGTLLRVLLGFFLAAIAAGLALVLHADTPTEILARSGGAVGAGELTAIGELALKAGTHIAIFAAPFALIVAAIAEWQRARGVWFYVLAGLAIAAGGFMAQHASEAAGQQTVLNEYAIRAFGIAGLVAGLVYWLVAGRCAGGRADDDLDAVGMADGDGDRAPLVATPAAEPIKKAEAPADAPAPKASAATAAEPAKDTSAAGKSASLKSSSADKSTKAAGEAEVAQSAPDKKA